METVEQVAAQCEVAFSAPPPTGLDAAMLEELVKAANQGLPFWEVMAEPKRRQQREQLLSRVRLAAMQLYKAKVKEQSLKLRQEEQERKASQAAGATQPKPRRQAEAPAPAEAPEPSSQIFEGAQPPAEPTEDEEEEAAQAATDLALQHLADADEDTLLRNTDDLLASQGVPGLNPVHALALQTQAKPKAAKPKTKSVPRKRAPPPVGGPRRMTWTTGGATQEQATSSQQPASEAPSQAQAVGADEQLARALELGDESLFDSE